MLTSPPLIEHSLSFDAQVDLLKDVELSGEKLANALAKNNLSYDDLSYANSKTLMWDKGRPKHINDFKKASRDIPFVSFFTGCGGMDLGFEAAGFSHSASFEFNELFCETLRKNKPEWNIYGPPIHNGDISKVDEVIETLKGKLQIPFDGVFIGGPPCQPFSIAANQRFSKSGTNFKRTGFSHKKNGNLLFDYIRIIKHFKPKVFLIENVTGLRDLDGGKQLAEALEILRLVGYSINEPYILNAAEFGIPQQRVRLFVVGSLSENSFSLPEKSPHKFGAASVLYNLPNGVENHQTRQHSASSVLRYMMLNYGSRDKLGRVDRLSPILPSKTVIAGGTNGGGRSHLHPEIPRTLSVRESARLQTFPDNYIFVGPIARQFTQVGNAVPPVLSAQLAQQVMEAFF